MDTPERGRHLSFEDRTLRSLESEAERLALITQQEWDEVVATLNCIHNTMHGLGVPVEETSSTVPDS